MKIYFLLPFLWSLLLPFILPGQSSQYVILTTVDDTTDSYYPAVTALRDYRSARVVDFDPSSVEALVPVLAALAPRYVAIVLKPTELDINFIRRFLEMSTLLDDDPFSDFSYGFITGATGQDAVNFANSIIYADTHGIYGYPLNIGGYAASSINFVYPFATGFMTYLDPPSASYIYMETSDSGTGRTFFLANTAYLMNNKILDIGYNGDPHMVWLFEGGNINPNPPVWVYDPTKIENPAYARVGITSQDIGALNLYPAVAFNGACHSGEPKTVMVEGDIAATFGDTQGIVEFYTMSDGFSFALSILKTGITGYFAPCGANNANDQGEDIYNAFLFHEPLGDIHKRSNDAVVMGFLGNRPNLKIYSQGQTTYGCDVLTSGTFDPSDWSGACYMLGGKANRIYFGDPMFNPYRDNHSDSLQLVHITMDSVSPDTRDIQFHFHKPDGYWPVWDKFHFGNTRIYAPVELPSNFLEVSGFAVTYASGPYDLVIHATEHFEGKTILHIEADVPNDLYSPVDYTIRFHVVCLLTGDAPRPALPERATAFPDPADNTVTIRFPGRDLQEHLLILYDSRGQVVQRIQNITGGRVTIDAGARLAPGIYFYRIFSSAGPAIQGRFILK